MDKSIGTPGTFQVFSQESVAITNVLAYTCLFPLSALGHKKTLKHKKAEEKSQFLHNFRKNSKIGSDKIIGTLNLMCGGTPFGENNLNQSFPITIS